MHVLKLRAEEKKIFSLPTSSPNKLLYGLAVSFIRAFPFAKDLSMILVYAFVLCLPFYPSFPRYLAGMVYSQTVPSWSHHVGKRWLARGQGDAWLEDGGRVRMEPYVVPTKDHNTTLTLNWTNGELFPCLSSPGRGPQALKSSALDAFI